jgi:hypothetical protein
MLRRRSYLKEADIQRDVENRRVAEGFYESLINWVRNYSDKLDRDKGGGLIAHADSFWKHPKARKLIVLFIPSATGKNPGIGKYAGSDIIVLPYLIGEWDTRYLDTRINKDSVIHEMIHFLDPGRGKKSTHSARRADAGDVTGYYNDSSEWNAYWQEGAATFDRLIVAPMTAKGSKAFDHFFGDGSLDAVRKRVERFWDIGFLDNMSRETTRRFDKRLAALWKYHKDRGEF